MNRVLKVGDETERHLLPFLILVVGSQKLIQFLNFIVDVLNCETSVLCLKIVVQINIGLEHHIFFFILAITGVITARGI